MRHDTTHEPTRALLDGVRAAYEASEPPAPRSELAALFVTGLTNDNGDLLATAASNALGSASQTAGLPNWTRRHNTMVKDLMSHVSTRVAAVVAGATVAMAGMGAAGALNAPISFVSSFGEDAEECVVTPEDEVTEDGTTEDGTTEDGTVGCEDQGDDEVVDVEVVDVEVDDVEDGDETDDPATDEYPAIPTTVSEAAHIHDFDEACGNHGAYVSHMARFGEEPECATEGRAAAEDDDSVDDDGAIDEVIDDAADDSDKDERNAQKNASKGGGKGKR